MFVASLQKSPSKLGFAITFVALGFICYDIGSFGWGVTGGTFMRG